MTTANIPDGSYTVSVSNLPAGVTVSGNVTIAGNTGTLTLAGDTSTVAGTTSTLTLTVNGVTSAPFTLTVSAPSGDPGDNTLLYAGIAVAALIAVIGIGYFVFIRRP